MNEIYVERQESLLRIVSKENNEMKELFVEEENEAPYPGEIYKGVVKSIVPAIKCAFIDIGFSKNCYMYLDNKFKNMHIKKGDELIVEVLKEEVGEKGAKVTNAFSIPGNYCVLEHISRGISFSDKIKDAQFKKNLLDNINKFEDVGFKIRTKAVDTNIENIKIEMDKLYEIYKEVLSKGTYSLKPGLVFSDKGILDKILRDIINENTSKIFCNYEEDWDYIVSYLTNRPDVKAEIILHKHKRNLMDFYGIEKDILALRNKKVYLKCGGHIIIEKTEAMYVIDVNSGGNTKSNSLEKTALNTNIEAAREICRQIRLRNLAGIILIDFIDMNNEEYRNKILDELNQGFKDDKNKTVIHPFTELNLVQIARRRRGEPILSIIEESCRECNGNGKRLNIKYLFLLIKNAVFRLDEETNVSNIMLYINHVYKEQIISNIKYFAEETGAFDKSIYINFENDEEYFRIEALIFESHVNEMAKYKVYTPDLNNT